MKTKFANFIEHPTKENFLELRNEVINHEDYNPYSNDWNQLTDLLDAERFEEAIEFNTVNLLLSPRAHLYKQYALEKLGNQQHAGIEGMIAHYLMDGIEMTGNGSIESPYLVTSVTDERDMLMRWDEEFASQALTHSNNQSFDIITTASGKEYYFDITDCYRSLQKQDGSNNQTDLMKEIETLLGTKSAKKWWEFWK